MFILIKKTMVILNATLAWDCQTRKFKFTCDSKCWEQQKSINISKNLN